LRKLQTAKGHHCALADAVLIGKPAEHEGRDPIAVAEASVARALAVALAPAPYR